jgi:hypothetical protein
VKHIGERVGIKKFSRRKPPVEKTEFILSILATDQRLAQSLVATTVIIRIATIIRTAIIITPTVTRRVVENSAVVRRVPFRITIKRMIAMSSAGHVENLVTEPIVVVLKKTVRVATMVAVMSPKMKIIW